MAVNDCEIRCSFETVPVVLFHEVETNDVVLPHLLYYHVLVILTLNSF